MFCRRCGAELPADAAACPRCQEPVLLPGTPAGFASPGFQPPAPATPYPPFTTGHWSAPPQAGQPLPPAGQQFNVPPPIPPSAWLTSAGPTGSAPPPPPSRPLLETLFGPSPRPGVVLVHTNGVQRRFLSRLQPTTAGSAWVGALVGGALSFVVAFFLAVICSLLLGSILDQAFASLAALLNLLSGSVSTSGSVSQGISFYSNPLVLFDYAHRSAFIFTLAGSTSNVSVNADFTITPPVTFLLLIPAIGLLFGGYFAASTDYTGRRLFSMMRGASICIVYALLALLLSLVTSVDLASSSSASATATITIAPDSLSVFLNSLLCGLVFGALGGYLRARSFPTATTGPLNRRNMRLRAAWLGARFSLTTFFAICLALVLALYILAQIGGPALQTEGSPAPTGSASASTCHVFLQQPSTAPSPAPTSSVNSAISGPVWFLVDSPPLAVWLMTISLGAPIQLTGSGLGSATNTSIGLVGGDCGPGPQGALLYLFLVIPAIAFFLGGRRAARSTYANTAGDAAGTGMLMAGMAALGMGVLAFITPITLTVLSLSLSFGPSLLWSFIATLLFGVLFGVPGALSGRSGARPQPTPLAYVAWPMGPGAAAGAVPGSDPFHDAPTRLSGPLDIHNAPTLISGGIAPPQTPPAFSGGADIWHAPTQAPGSGSISDTPTQTSNPGDRPGPLPPTPPGNTGQ